MQEATALALRKASALFEQGETQAALQLCEQTISQDSNVPLLQRFYASLQLKQNNYDAAELALKKALALDSSNRETAHLLAIVCSDNQNPLLAHDLYQQLLAQPCDVKLINDYALNLCRLGRFEEALGCYRKVLDHDPNHIVAAFNLGTLQLFLGDFDAGWKGYSLRYLKDQLVRPQLAPDWLGESLEGKHIVIYREQGIGDELLMATCYQDVLDQAARCTILCNPRLNGLFSRTFPAADVVDIDQMTEDRIDSFHFDRQVSAADLPGFFRKSGNEFADTTQLIVNEETKRRLRKRLENEGRQHYVGLSWLGGKSLGSNINYRSFSLQALYSLLKTPNVCWVNLQHGKIEAEVQQAIADTGAHIITVEEASPYGDFDDYGALIGALDCVVSADNAVSNLAGAIGQKCFLLASTYPFWWWTYNQDTNPWFPTVDVFFKAAAESSWDSLVNAVQSELTLLFEKTEQAL